MLDIGHEQGRKTPNLDPRTEENLELAGEDGNTFFAVGRCKDYWLEFRAQQVVLALKAMSKFT